MIENKYILKLRELTTLMLKDEKEKIVLFGSRARGKNHVSSDIDIGIIPLGKINERKITALRERVENLNIPLGV